MFICMYKYFYMQYIIMYVLPFSIDKKGNFWDTKRNKVEHFITCVSLMMKVMENDDVGRKLHL